MLKFISREPINKGWSKDKKYRVKAEDGRAYLLRVSAMEQYDRKKHEYELTCQVATLGIPMCRPVAFGTSEEGVYTVQTWIDGVDAEEAIRQLTGDQQYAYGLEAGRILKKIHQIPAPQDIEDWEKRFNRKADRKIQIYEACPLKYENGQALIDCVNANRHWLKNRPQVYQHGDYHIGNMMIGNDSRLYVIDFDREDYGDPWEEFNRIVWCAQQAPRFASGMVDGYFDHDVPLAFWQLLTLYISSNTLSSLPWAIPFGDEEIEVFQRQTRDVLAWYDNMRRTIPTWYSGE